MSRFTATETIAQFAEDLTQHTPDTYTRLQWIMHRSRVFEAMSEVIVEHGQVVSYDEDRMQANWSYDGWNIHGEVHNDPETSSVSALWIARHHRRWGIGRLSRDFVHFRQRDTENIAVNTMTRYKGEAETYLTDSILPGRQLRAQQELRDMIATDPARLLQPEARALAMLSAYDPAEIITQTSRIMARTLGFWACALTDLQTK